MNYSGTALTDAQLNTLILEWAGETLTAADSILGLSNRRLTWASEWLTANAPTLGGTNYETTVPLGGTLSVCLRTADQTCPGGTTPTLSDDATLSALVLENDSGTAITLSPTFASGTTTYTATVGNAVDEITIIPTVNESNATFEIQDGSGTALTDADTATGFQVDLPEGDTEIQVEVTAEDASTETYEVTVTRSRRTTTTPAAPPEIEVPNDWNLKPSGLGAGDKFRLIFLSSTTTKGESYDIADYNTFIQGRAAAGHIDIRTYSSGFRALGCTADSDARDNAAITGTGVRIHWLNGNKVADNYGDFKDGTWDDEANDKNELGANGPDTSVDGNLPFTGCKDNGTEDFAGGISVALGAPGGTVRLGRPNSSVSGDGPLTSNSAFVNTATRPMYGLSQVFVVAAAAAAPTVSISADKTSAVFKEDGITYTLTRSGATTDALDVSVTLTQDKDFLLPADLTQTVTIAAGQSTGTFTVAASSFQDFATGTTVEAGTLTAAVQDGTDYDLGATSTVDVAIVIGVMVSLEVTSLSATEDAGTFSFKVIGRTGAGAPQPSSSTGTIRVLLQSGTAIKGTDFAFQDVLDAEFLATDFSADGATWKAERTFTVSIENDSLDEDQESFNLTVERHFTTSGVYSLVRNGNACGNQCVVVINITDDDTAGVTVSKSTLTVTEQDTTGDTYTLVLDSEPTEDVIISITGQGSKVVANPIPLTFTPMDWNTARTVTVKGLDDSDVANHEVMLTHTAASTDSNYGGIAIDGVTVTVNDNDTAKVTGVTLVPGNQRVVVAWTQVSNATGYQVQWKSGGQSYNNTRQSVVSGSTTAVTVSGLTLGTEYTFRVRATRTGANDGPYSDEEMATPRNEGVTFSKSMLTVTEEDTTGDSYTIVLDTQPTGDVTITISGHAGTEVTPNPASLTFTTSNWETAQTVTVTAGNDGDTADDMVTLSHSGSSTDNAYDAEAAGVSVTVLDNDDTAQVTGLTLTPGNGRLVANWTAVTDATGYQVQWKSGVQSYNNSGRRAVIASGATVSHTIPSLTNGTTYTVRVRATQTGADAGAYSDEAMDAPVAGGSTDATLSALALKVAEDGSTIDLNESFSSATKSYTADVANDVLEITVEPTSDHNATFAYLDGSDTALTDTDANNAGFQTMLLEGANTIKVKVTAEDGNTTDTYTVVVTRAMTTITPPSGNVLVSNLGQTDGGIGSFASFDQAQAFTTGDNFGGYALTSVEIQTASTTNLNRLTASIHADSSGSPGANVGTLTKPDSVGGDGIATYTASGAGIDLVKETTYFIVVDASGSATGSMQNTGSDAEDAGGAANWSIADGSLYRSKDATGAWTAFGDTKKIRIFGTVTPGMASTDAGLTGLALKDASDDSTIDLNESFATATTSYTADVGNDVAAATVEPALSDSNATVAYLDASDTALTDADANKTGFQTALFVGETTIKVKVTAEDEATTETYTVVVTRTAATATTEVTIAADAATAIYNEIGASFTVTRTGATTDALDVVVALTQSKQFLDAGELSRTVRIAAGSASGTLSISSGDLLLPDTETRESGTLTATVLPGTGYNPGTTATASVDVVVALTVSFDELSYSVNEGVGTLQVMLVGRTGVGAPVPGSTWFSVSTARLSPPEAVSPEDYSSLSVVVEIPGSAYVADGNVYKAEIPVEVVIVDDLRDEPDEDFHLELDKSPGQAFRHSNLTDADGVGCRNPVCGTPITIEDNDATPTVTLVLTPDSITENGGISRVTATLDHPSSETTTINISMTPVSPAVAGDYNLSTTQRLTIEPGDTEDSGTGLVSLQAVNNAVYIGNKSVTISGTASNDLAIVQPQAKTLTIEDDESGTDTDATLSGLALKIAADDSAVALTPVFASATTSYTATVGIGMDEITVEATENDSNATVAYLDGSDTALTDTDAHKAGFQTAVAEGANTIKVKVTAEDRATTRTYTVVVTRATAATDADLTGLALKIAADDSTVALTPGFTTAGTSYTAMVANPVLSITVEPALSDSNAAVAYLNFADVERVDADPVKAGFQVELIGGQNTIKVRVTAEDDQTTKTYTVVVMRAFNTEVVGKPAIEGTAQVGETLTALIGSIADVDGLPDTFPDDYDFQWARVDADGASNETDIFTATSHTYMPVAEDVGKKVKVRVSFTDAGGNPEAPGASDAYPSSGTITDNAPTGPATGKPNITGTIEVGETLTADTSGISDPDGNMKAENGETGFAYTYQWIRVDGTTETNITGATGSTYTLVEADEGKGIRVKVSFTDDADNPETVTSDAYHAVVILPAPRLPAVDDPNAIWMATLTVANLGSNQYGYDGSQGGLTDTAFTWLGDDTPLSGGGYQEVGTLYTIDELFYHTGTGQLLLSLDGAFVDVNAADNIFVDVGGERKSFSDANLGIHTYTFPNFPNPSWSAGDEVPVKIVVLKEANGPENLVATSTESGDGFDVALTWDAPAGGGTVTAYRVEYQPDPALQWRTLAASQSGLTYTDSGLARGTVRYYRVAALRSGSARYSEVVRVQAPSETTEIPEKVSHVDVEPAEGSDTALEVAWSRARTPNSRAPATGYHVQHAQHDGAVPDRRAGEDWASVTFPNWMESLPWRTWSGVVEAIDFEESTQRSPYLKTVVTGLAPGTSYRVRVRGCTEAGCGEWSYPRRWTTSGATSNATDAEPLTATLEGFPANHDGSSAFTFRIAFSAEVEITPQDMRDHALTVAGGTVTNATRVDGRSDLWELTVEPAGTGAVSVLVPLERACTETGALCTADGQMLATAPGHSVPGPAQGQQAPAPLAAGFVSVPGEHDGETAFWLELSFDAAVAQGSKTGLRALLGVTGGSQTRMRRKDGRLDHWRVRVEPSSHEAVTVTLAPSPPCGATGAVCTPDGRTFTSALATQIQGPPGLTVADAQVQEAANATLAFAVTLDRAPSGTVTVDYATSNGTATAGSDYTAAAGTLTFAAGETAKTVSVAVLDDAHDEGSETLTLTLSNASGAHIADGTATGTINNTDPMPKAWLARFGRTVGSQVVDALTQRLEGASGSHVTVGGIPLTGAPGAVPEAEPDDPFGLPDWATRAQREESAQSLTANELLLGSAFHLSSGGGQGAGAAYTAWGRVATSGFAAEDDGVTMDAEVTSGLVGFDAEWARILAGVMFSHSTGEGDYRLSAESGGRTGSVESSLTGVYPYARVALNARVSAWALAGAANGELTLKQEGDAPMPAGIAMRMGAAGLKGRVLDGTGASGVALEVKTDALWVGTKSEDTSELAPTEGDVTRLRVTLAGERAFAAGEGARLTPSAEVGVRHDGGDAESGTGLEVGAGLRYVAGALTVEGQVRTLVAHEDSGYQEWGVSGAVRITPSASGRGLMLSFAPQWGRTASAVQRLWSAPDASALGAGGEFEGDARLVLDAGYGVGLGHGRGVLTPYAGLVLGDAGSRTVRTGARWQVGADAVLGLEGTRQTSGTGEAGNELMLRMALRF